MLRMWRANRYGFSEISWIATYDLEVGHHGSQIAEQKLGRYSSIGAARVKRNAKGQLQAGARDRGWTRRAPRSSPWTAGAAWPD
jgi:hypothetical protein